MSDEKKRDDSTRANELLSLLKKYWKLEDGEPDAVNSVPETDAAVEKNADEFSDKSTEAELYDGIISNADDVVNGKKKYRGIPDDEPLFVFDSFDFSDENSDFGDNGDIEEASSLTEEAESDGIESEAQAETGSQTLSETEPDTSDKADDVQLTLCNDDVVSDVSENGDDIRKTQSEEDHIEQYTAHNTSKKNRNPKADLVQMTFSMLDDTDTDGTEGEDITDVVNEPAIGNVDTAEIEVADVRSEEDIVSDGSDISLSESDEELEVVESIAEETDHGLDEPEAVSEVSTENTADCAESQIEATDGDSEAEVVTSTDIGENDESVKTPTEEAEFVWDDVNDFDYYGDESDDFEIGLTVIDGKELNGELSEYDGGTVSEPLNVDIPENDIDTESETDTPTEPENISEREEKQSELGDQPERVSDQRFKGLFGNRRVGFGTRNGIAPDTVSDDTSEPDSIDASKDKEGIDNSGEDDIVSVPAYLTDVDDNGEFEESVEIAEEIEETSVEVVDVSAEAQERQPEEPRSEIYEPATEEESDSDTVSVADEISASEELFLPPVIEIVDDDEPVEPEYFDDEYLLDQHTELADEYVEEKPRENTAEQADGLAETVDNAVKTEDNGFSNELEEPAELAAELEEAVSFAEEYKHPIDENEVPLAIYELSEDPEEAPEVAEEVEELLLAEEITSETSAPKPTVTVEEKTAPYSDWTQDDGFLRECAQLELPKLSVMSRPVSEAESDEIPDAVSSGYSYTDAEKDRLSEDEIVERKSETAAKNRKKLRSSLNKSFCAFILAVVTVIYERLGYFFGLKSAFSGEIPLLMFGVDVLLTALCVFILRDAFVGLRSDIRKRLVKAEFVGCISVVAVLVYDLISVIILRGKIAAVTPLGSVAAVCTFLSILFSSVRIGQDIRIFNMTCQSKEYSTFVRMEKNSAVPEYREFEGMISPNAQLFCLNKVEDLDAACRDDRTADSETKFFAVFTASLWVISVAVGAFGIIKGASVYSGVRLAALLALCSLPCSLCAAFAAVRGRMLKRAAIGRSTVTSDEAVSELKNGAIVIIRDTELFPPENIKVKSYDVAVESLDGAPKTTSIERSLSHVVSLFKKMGGTLSEIFGTEESGIRLCDGVVFTDISEKGVSALIEGVYVRIGSAAYLGGYGIPVVADVTEREADERVLYASDNGVFCTKLVLSFKADKELCKRINRLRKYGVAVSVKTCDPCIDAALILSTAGLEPELVKVVRYSIVDDREFDRSTREGGIVSFGGASGAFTALAACFKAKGALKLCRILAVVFSLLGGACVLLGAVFELKFIGSAMFVCVYQLVCAIASALLARLK